MNQQKTCADCANYRQHYTFRKNKQFLPTNCGHCTLQYANGRFRKPDKLCEKFVDKEKL